MPKYRHSLPQLGDKLFLTDGGLETTLVFHDGIELPCFAAFPLLNRQVGRERLRDYYVQYASMALAGKAGFILESVTWRANRDWGRKLGYSPAALAAANRSAIDLLVDLRSELETAESPMVISGNIGPRGDGYRPDARMTADQAADYHSEQIAVLAATEADFASAFTLNYPEEAIGVAAAASAVGVPVVISFTVETDGRLPTGHTLRQAIEMVDASTGNAPVYFMANCAHPTHLEQAWAAGEAWTRRIRGLRANASALSHAELDAATELDAGNPHEFARQYRDIRAKLPQITILGGCCGTDHRHVEAVAHSCLDRGQPVAAAA
jgi:S-methylmethionine-dependent homocysteine/selenocysteine methylase